jgi:hypothetical protein
MDWTPEKISKLTDESLKSLKENALRLGKSSVAAMCDDQLAQRKAPKRGGRTSGRQKPKGSVVIGFHFVCDREKGLTKNDDGTFWTGTWVVDKRHAAQATKVDAYVALHQSKLEFSYLQGTILDWRKSPRERQYRENEVQTDEGVDFLFRPTDEALEWVGDGAGEKGYNWGYLTEENSD